MTVSHLPNSTVRAVLTAGAIVFFVLATACGSRGPDEATRAQAAQELQQLREANQELHRLRVENQELERLRRENQELAKLRPVSDELPKLRQENGELRAQLQALKPTPKGR
jgi:hypothetical protein